MNESMQIYSASCHCGAVEFTFKSTRITTGCRCNCSICRRKGAVMSTDYFPPQTFLAMKGLDALTVYRFGDRMVNHYFCKRCGIYPFHDTLEKPGHRRINLGCVDGLDLQALKIELINGSDF